MNLFTAFTKWFILILFYIYCVKSKEKGRNALVEGNERRKVKINVK